MAQRWLPEWHKAFKELAQWIQEVHMTGQLVRVRVPNYLPHLNVLLKFFDAVKQLRECTQHATA